MKIGIIAAGQIDSALPRRLTVLGAHKSFDCLIFAFLLVSAVSSSCRPPGG